MIRILSFSHLRGAILAAALTLVGSGVMPAQPLNPGNSGMEVVPRSRVIDSPGHYVLNRDLSFGANLTDAGLTIRSNDVTVDLNGHAIVGPGQMLGMGIRIEGAKGVTVRNGRVGDFHFNVVVEDSYGVTLEGLQIRGQGILPNAPPPETAIMIVQSSNVVVRNNSINNTGLGIFVRGGHSQGNRLEGNTITSTMNGLLGICYNPAPDDERGPRGDWVTGNLISGYNIGVQMNTTAMYNVVQGNTIAYNPGGMGFEFRNDTNQELDNVTVPLP